MFESGSRCCWRHASPANSMDGFKSHTLHQMNGDVTQMDQERFGPNEDGAGSSPAIPFGRIAETD